MKNKLFGIVLSLLTIMFFIVACKKNASSIDKDASSEPFKVNFVPAKTSNELKALQADGKSNIIRTIADFDRIVSIGATPLSKLSTAELNAFRTGMTFREGVGVTSFSYEVLEDKLSYEDFAEVLSYFGLDAKGGFWGFSNNPTVIEKLKQVQHLNVHQRMADDEDGEYDEGEGGDYGYDYKGYKCLGVGTCFSNRRHICLTGC